MGAKSRNKGSAFERDVGVFLFEQTGVSFKRNLEQVREAQHGDLVADHDAFPFLIECKRYAAGRRAVDAWKTQAEQAATRAGKIPAVVYRFDRDEMRACVPLSAVIGRDVPGWCDIPMISFACLARELMAEVA